MDISHGEASPHARTAGSEWTVWQDAEVVAKFTADRRAGILGGVEQLEVLCQLLPAPSMDARVLDLGCGDGILLETVLRRWPGARGVALDGSPEMLERAAARLGESQATPILADFNTPDWAASLPFSSFDAIVSGFAIHHSEDDRKRTLYGELFGLLKEGGVFVNIEHVASPTPLGETLFERAYARHLVAMRATQGETVTFEQVLHEVESRLDKSANRLTPVETQLRWLREIGFEDVDCYWKHYELAILAGYRRLPTA